MEHLNNLFGVVKSLTMLVVLTSIISCTTSSYTILETIDNKRKCEGDCVNGFGKSFYEHQPNVVLYEGNWINGREDGNGALYFPDGQLKYKGYWEKGMMHGDGGLMDESTGERIYQGNFVNGLMEGKGTYIYSNGFYDGTFLKGMKHGEGTYVYKDGAILTGNWENDVLVGINELSENGAVITTTKEGLETLISSRCLVPGDCKNGTGTLIYFNNSKYIGEFKDAKRHGTGTFYDKSGKIVYKGDWNNNLKHGEGVMYYENGKKWIEGTWESGQKHGTITYYHKTGEKYATEQFEKGVSERIDLVTNQ